MCVRFILSCHKCSQSKYIFRSKWTTPYLCVFSFKNNRCIYLNITEIYVQRNNDITASLLPFVQKLIKSTRPFLHIFFRSFIYILKASLFGYIYKINKRTFLLKIFFNANYVSSQIYLRKKYLLSTKCRQILYVEEFQSSVLNVCS